jgi:hypothetical protein
MKTVAFLLLSLLTTTACGPDKVALEAAAQAAIAKHEAAKAAEAEKAAALAAAQKAETARVAEEAAKKAAATVVKYRFDPPGNGVCALFRGSFNADGQAGPEEQPDSILGTCSGQRNAMSCRLAMNGELGTNIFTGSVGTKNGKTFVESSSGVAIYRLLDCRASGRCKVLQMFNGSTKVGTMCVDPSM